MLDDIKKIINKYASKRVFLLMDSKIGGNRRTGTAVMILEANLKYLILLRYEQDKIPSLIRFVQDNIKICTDQLKLNPLILIIDQESSMLKYISDFIEPSMVCPTDEGSLLKTWIYRDPQHLFFQFDRVFARRTTCLNPSIFTTLNVHCFNSEYKFKYHTITEKREIFQHMDDIGDHDVRRKLEVVAKFFEICFQKTFLVEKPFDETEFAVIREIQFQEVKKKLFNL
jgi:hypothetical protein